MTAYTSLILAGDLISAGSENGQVAFIQPGRTYKEIALSEVSPYRSTQIIVGEKVFLLTREDIRAIQ